MHKNQLQLRDGVRKNRIWTHSCIEWNVWMQFDWNRTYHRAHLFRSTFLARLMRTTSTECFMPVQQTIALFMIFIVYSSDSNNTHHTRMTYNSKETVDGYMCICNTARLCISDLNTYAMAEMAVVNNTVNEPKCKRLFMTLARSIAKIDKQWTMYLKCIRFANTQCIIFERREKKQRICILRTMMHIYGVIWLVFRHNESFFAIKLTNFNIYTSF